MAVRSRRFFGPTTIPTANTWTKLYECPAGRTARFSLVVVKQGGSAVQASIGLGVGNTLIAGIWSESLPIGATREMLRELILDPGDSIWGFTAAASGLTVAGFGSLLAGAPA